MKISEWQNCPGTHTVKTRSKIQLVKNPSKNSEWQNCPGTPNSYTTFVQTDNHLRHAFQLVRLDVISSATIPLNVLSSLAVKVPSGRFFSPINSRNFKGFFTRYWTLSLNTLTTATSSPGIR